MRRSALSLFLLIFGGCVFHISGPLPDIPLERYNSFPAPLFSYEKCTKGKCFEKALAEKTETYDIFRIRLPLPEPRNAQYFQSRTKAKNGLIIVLPLYGEHEFPAELLVWFLTIFNYRADFNVLYIQEEKNDDPFDLDAFTTIKSEEELILTARDSVQRTRKAVIGIRHFLDWAEQDPSMDIKHVGIVGLSTASLLISVIMAVEPRISAGVIAFGGGNLHEIFAHATEPRLARVRTTVLERSGKTAEEFSSLLQLKFRDIEPVRYAHAINPQQILYLDAAQDEFLPQKGRDALWNALGAPSRITYHHRHRSAFISMTPLGLNTANYQIAGFLRKAFQE